MAAACSATRWKKTDLAWLALAIGIHCALLLLPLHQPSSPPEPRPAITVNLVPVIGGIKTQTTPVIVPLLAAKQPTAPASQPSGEANTAPPTSISARVSAPANPGLPDQTTTPIEVNRMSAARLVDLVSRMSFTEAPTPAARQLGAKEYSKQAPSWRTGARAGAIGPERNRFEGMMAPAETELVDRWQAADSSQNVVINTPGGETLCGRAEAWDPMQPLVEHLMMFRSCGGGGKRTFTMDRRELP